MGAAPSCTCATAPCASAVDALPLACTGKQWDPATLADWELLRAAGDGDWERIEQALANGADIETRGDGFMRPRSQKDQVLLPDDAQADFRASEVEGQSERGIGLTPLMHAAKEGKATAVQKLLDRGASISARDEDGMAALHFAASAGSHQCCALLLAEGADASLVDDFGRDAFGCLPHGLGGRGARDDWASLLRAPPKLLAQTDISASANIFGQRIS
mmetsp:Transcript_89550/g.256490  ORF Transcript_89550/g.256490 Transcript_89550/m.256490 type:complete len:218 (+) Transcript_89550:60-713(+)